MSTNNFCHTLNMKEYLSKSRDHKLLKKNNVVIKIYNYRSNGLSYNLR